MDTPTQPEVLLHDPSRAVWLHFTDPIAIVEAHTPADVLPALATVHESVTARGCHAAGFVAYEAAPAFDPALRVSGQPSAFPLLWFGLFRAPVVRERFAFTSPPNPLRMSWAPSISRNAYSARIAQLREYLYRGDTYQVNFTLRLRSSFDGDSRALFAQLVQAQGPHYSAYLRTGAFTLCSASPELFFRLDHDTLESRPMKGTIRRGLTSEEDLELAGQLRLSEKNRAENVMIVDMIRNDMGRIAVPGSVSPVRLFDVERYPTVWQMTSTVTCRTLASFPEILSALFPCASITGAPKPRTMEIISELEDSPRRIYTGAIGYIGPDRQAQFNVAIRTILLDESRRAAEYGVGGGIVWDSSPQEEYDECLLKAAVLLPAIPDFSLLETMLWTPAEGWFLLDRHLGRLAESAGYFGFSLSLSAIRERLSTWVAAQHAAGGRTAMRVRLLAARDGGITLEAAPLAPPDGSAVRVALAPAPIRTDDPFLYHKTTRRSVYEEARAACPDAEDALLWNDKGELTESTIANLVVELDGQRITPPVRCGLLPGTFRAELLAQGTVHEGIVRIEDLPRCTGIYLVSSVRQWRTAVLVTQA